MDGSRAMATHMEQWIRLDQRGWNVYYFRVSNLIRGQNTSARENQRGQLCSFQLIPFENVNGFSGRMAFTHLPKNTLPDISWMRVATRTDNEKVSQRINWK